MTVLKAIIKYVIITEDKCCSIDPVTTDFTVFYRDKSIVGLAVMMMNYN